MARDYNAYSERGATIAAIVIDTPEQNAAMAEKLALPFPILSDPDGERAIKPCDVWDESGKMATPAIIVLAPDGQEIYRQGLCASEESGPNRHSYPCDRRD